MSDYASIRAFTIKAMYNTIIHNRYAATVLAIYVAHSDLNNDSVLASYLLCKNLAMINCDWI